MKKNRKYLDCSACFLARCDTHPDNSGAGTCRGRRWCRARVVFLFTFPLPAIFLKIGKSYQNCKKQSTVSKKKKQLNNFLYREILKSLVQIGNKKHCHEPIFVQCGVLACVWEKLQRALGDLLTPLFLTLWIFEELRLT